MAHANFGNFGVIVPIGGDDDRTSRLGHAKRPTASFRPLSSSIGRDLNRCRDWI
jgi:hypothetical protein